MKNVAVRYGGRKLSKGACFVPPLSADFARRPMIDMHTLHQNVLGSRISIVLFEPFHSEGWNEIPGGAIAFTNRGWHQNVVWQ